MDFGPLTVLVGPNGTGKSSVLDALDFLLGARWPSMNSLSIPNDITNFDEGRTLEIQAEFDPPFVHEDTLGTKRNINAIRYRYGPYKKNTRKAKAGDPHETLDPLGEDGSVPRVATGQPQKGSRPRFDLLRVSADLRAHSSVLFISGQRAVASQALTRRRSALAELLEDARRKFERDEGDRRTAFQDQYRAALELLRADDVVQIEETISRTTRRMLGFLGGAEAAQLDVRFGFVDAANPFASLRLECRDGDHVLPAEAMGLGIQSAIVVGVFEALRQLKRPLGMVAIEEPEMFLHPQAQRYFRSLLWQLADEGNARWSSPRTRPSSRT